MPLTIDQQRAVEAPGDACVTAGAGTGKTHMLSARYLELLRAHALTPLAVVATTFTDAAAAELRARIRQDVAKAEPPFPPEVAAELEAAPIMTMHALAARICREHPDAAQVPADFSILEERPEGPIWVAEQLDEAIAALPDTVHQAVPAGLLRLALEAFLKDPLTAEEALACEPSDLEAVLEAEKAAVLADLQADPEWREAVSALRNCAGIGLRETERVATLGVVDALARHQPGTPWPDLSEVLAIKLNVGSGQGWDKAQYTAVKGALKLIKARLADEPLLQAEPGALDDELAAMIPALRLALAEVRRRLGEAKVRERVLDFGDLEVHALRALEVQEVLDYYRLRWRAFLLDEVQDTNPVQERLLSRLTGGAILTIVGDEKQSIYGFRRADVSVFGRLAEAIAGRGGLRVSLAQSFRTHGPLMSAINQVCGPALGAMRQDLLGERPAPHDGPHLEAATAEKQKGQGVELRRRMEARFIARRLKAWHDQGMQIHDKRLDALRRVEWGDMALLFRSGTAMALYEEALAAEGIPTALARGSDLFSTREALDALALLRYLADRRDDLALVAVLRSPFFAVSDSTLHRLAERRGKTPWWSLVAQSTEPELEAAREVLAALGEQRFEPPSRLLQLADRLTGYSAVLAGMPGARRRLADWNGAIAQVRALENGAQDVLTVVRRLKKLAEAEVEFDRPPLEAGNAVVLMTIHASKGLEWPVVVVPNLSSRGPADTARVRFDARLGVGLSFRDVDGALLKPLRLQILARQQARREEAEERRIFYVALTRARDRLLLTAPDSSGGPLTFLSPGLEEAGIPIETIVPQPGDDRPPQPGLPEAPGVPSRWFEKPLGACLTELPVTALAAYADCPRSFAFRYVDGHPGSEEVGPHGAVPSDDALELVPPLPVPVPHANRVGTAAHLALELALDDAEALARHVPDLSPELVAEALAYAKAFRSEEAFRGVREAIDERERPITLRVEGLELRGVVDALGPGFVLDYKTDRVMNPDHHAMQLWAYTQAVGDSRAYLAYLRHGKLVELTPERLEAAGAQAVSIVQAIRAGHFDASPDAGRCGGCPYALLCPDSASQVEKTGEQTGVVRR